MSSKNKILIPVQKTKCNAVISFDIFNLHPNYDAITLMKIKCIVSEHRGFGNYSKIKRPGSRNMYLSFIILIQLNTYINIVQHLFY